MRWRRNDEHRRAADTNVSFDMLFLHVRNGFDVTTYLEAGRVQELTGTDVPIHQIVQMTKEIVAIQNGVTQQ